jgi:hypothetical protein
MPGYECNWCGHGPLVYLGTLGRMTHWRCQACGSDTHIPADALDDDLTEAIAEMGY